MIVAGGQDQGVTGPVPLGLLLLGLQMVSSHCVLGGHPSECAYVLITFS